jgi:hypothetical protein
LRDKPNTYIDVEAYGDMCGEEDNCNSPRRRLSTLKEKAGARNISSEINKILIEYFAKKNSMFGTMKQTDPINLRDHKDRCITS